jgi:tellurite resistance protein TerC
MTAVPVWAWAVTFGVLAVLIAADLVLMSRIGDSLRVAAIESALWLGAALAFGGVLWLWRGPTAGSQYLAGYLLERALSVDNIFVFVLLFVSMQVPAALQRRILFLGVLGALVLRGAFIVAGGALIERVSWIFYVFGAVVLLAGVRMFRAGEGGSGNNVAVRGLRRVLPVSERYDGDRLITRISGRTAATPLLVALWPSRSPTWCSPSTPSRRYSASPATCSWCSRRTPSPCSACGRCTSCWPARRTGSST